MALLPPDSQVGGDRMIFTEIDLVRHIIKAIGDHPQREGVRDTPKRVVKSWKELFGGYKQDPKEILSTTFEGKGYDQMVLLRDIEFYSTCEHHMLPFMGKCHIAYIPKERVVGLSKLARLTECFARRLQIQEQLTNQIADAMVECLKPVGVAVAIEAQHFCMIARGVGKQNSIMQTTSLRGVFKEEDSARSEFMSSIRG